MVMSKDTLIKSAYQIDVVANNRNDTHYADGDGFKLNAAFVIADGDVGDDTFLFFEHDDSIITGKKIFDGNNDGFVGFGKNGLLDIDRVNSKKAGNDQLSLSNGNEKITELRYLGEMNGQYAYADAETFHDFSKLFSSKTESKIGADTFDGGTILYDNQLGLNLGDDTILSAKDLKIVTTVALRDENGDGFVDSHFGMVDGKFFSVMAITGDGRTADDCGSIRIMDGGTLHLDQTVIDLVTGQTFYVYVPSLN